MEANNCEKCVYFDNGNKLYFECCCKIDAEQVIEDDNIAKRKGYVEVNGRWIKKKNSTKKLK